MLCTFILWSMYVLAHPYSHHAPHLPRSSLQDSSDHFYQAQPKRGSCTSLWQVDSASSTYLSIFSLSLTCHALMKSKCPRRLLKSLGLGKSFWCHWSLKAVPSLALSANLASLPFSLWIAQLLGIVFQWPIQQPVGLSHGLPHSHAHVLRVSLSHDSLQSPSPTK